MTEKKALRREIYARLSGLSIDSAAILSRLSPLIPDGASVFCFVGTPGETDTAPILRRWLSEGRVVAVPRWLPGGVMEPRRILSLSELQTDKRGFFHPPDASPCLPRPDVAVVPGLCFDRRGFRLGRGGGFYDRFLAAFDGLSIGLCPDALLFDALPVQAHDWPVNAVVTESAVWRIPKADGPLGPPASGTES